MEPGDVTQLLIALNNGESTQAEPLIGAVYSELRLLAAHHMVRESQGHTLQPTALVHEAYMRLIDQKRVRWQDRAHFFAIAAQAMRRVLIDHARKRKAARRGGGRSATLLDHHAITTDNPVDLIALDRALGQLRELDPRQAQTVELRFFAGLSVKDTAEILGVSEITVKRDWRYAKAWLYNAIQGESDASADEESEAEPSVRERTRSTMAS